MQDYNPYGAQNFDISELYEILLVEERITTGGNKKAAQASHRIQSMIYQALRQKLELLFQNS